MSHPNLTPKQEKFVQAYRRLGNQRQAYREAYDAENTSDAAADVAACRLLKNAKVALRLHTLQERGAKKAGVTVERLTELYFENIVKADAAGQYAAVNGALQGLGKLHGLITDKVNANTTNNTQINITGTISAVDAVLGRFISDGTEHGVPRLVSN